MEPKNEGIAASAESAKVSKGLNEERREALRRIGKFGAYTAPALLALLAADKAPAASDLA
jgi:hypothetical protein